MRVSVTALEIAAQFAVRGEVASMEALPGGHINRSFEVETRGPRGNSTYLLQRLNPAVFPDGAAVMGNIGAVTRFLERKLRETPGAPWKTLTLVSTVDDRDWYRAPDGACWRMFVFLPGPRFTSAATPRTRPGRPPGPSGPSSGCWRTMMDRRWRIPSRASTTPRHGSWRWTTRRRGIPPGGRAGPPRNWRRWPSAGALPGCCRRS